MASALSQAGSLLRPALLELAQRHRGVGSNDMFDIWIDNCEEEVVGKYYNARLKMSEKTVIFKRWELERGVARYAHEFIPRMLALVDKVYDRVSVARLINQAPVNLRRPGFYRPGCYRPSDKPRLVRSNPLLEKINVRMAA